ncbi:GNAT family N-acetyltransferase [Candidatus Methanoplasma termitum]|nr:GNAT family N-acetyltransferase [Candidatus Methanoplasma termitum]
METSVKHDEGRGRFDLYADGKKGGYLTYEIYGGSLDIQHTVVEPEFRGKGLGEILLDAAVKYANKKGLKIVPSCSFAAKKLS